MNNKDKLLYIVDHNDNWIGIQHTSVKVNGVLIEKFRTSYTNPFAVNFNIKLYMRYTAARVPSSLIPKGVLFIKVEIDMRQQDNHIYYREIGTHDLE